MAQNDKILVRNMLTGHLWREIIPILNQTKPVRDPRFYRLLAQGSGKSAGSIEEGFPKLESLREDHQVFLANVSFKDKFTLR